MAHDRIVPRSVAHGIRGITLSGHLSGACFENMTLMRTQHNGMHSGLDTNVRCRTDNVMTGV